MYTTGEPMTATRLSISRYDFHSLIDEQRIEAGAEIGVHHGWYSYYLLKHSKLKTLWSVDSYEGRHVHQKADAEILLSEFGQRSKIIAARSVDAARQATVGGQRFGFVYIDADHSYQAVCDDLTLWYPIILAGGILAGHDYLPTRHVEVIQAVDEFVAAHNLELFITREKWASWFVRKPA